MIIVTTIKVLNALELGSLTQSQKRDDSSVSDICQIKKFDKKSQKGSAIISTQTLWFCL